MEVNILFIFYFFFNLKNIRKQIKINNEIAPDLDESNNLVDGKKKQKI